MVEQRYVVGSGGMIPGVLLMYFVWVCIDDGVGYGGTVLNVESSPRSLNQ